MWRCALLGFLLITVCCGPVRAQGKAGLLKGLQGNNDSDNELKDVKGVLSQKLKQQSEEQTGSERIGDLTKQLAKEYTFRFDEDDDHPLSGIAVVKPDTKAKGGVWVGFYDEFEDGKKKKRWRIEMRKIEE